MTEPKHHDRDAEEAVLGGILLDNRVLAMLVDLEVYDFAHAELGNLFAAMRNLEAAGLPIDLVTVGNEVDRYAKQRGVTVEPADAVLATCALRCPAPENVPHYAAILRGHRRTRDAMTTLASLLGQAQRGSLEGEDLISEAAGEIMRLGERRTGEDPGKSVGAIIADECARMAAGTDATTAGMPTGLEKLDKLTGGIPFAVTTLLLARPGMGKTTLAENIAWSASILGNDTPLLYSYEDSHTSFAQRSMAQSSAVATERIRSRNFQYGDLAKLGEAKARMLARREVIVKAAGMGIDELIRDARSRRLRGAESGTVGRLVIVDYVQKMPEPDGRTRNERLGVLSRRLSEFAAKDGIAVIVCSQLNRGSESRDDHVPRLIDARESGDLEQDCKLALGLYRPAKYEQPPTGESGNIAPATLLEIHVLKNHNGQTDCHAEVFWDLETHTICDSAHELKARREMTRAA